MRARLVKAEGKYYEIEGVSTIITDRNATSETNGMTLKFNMTGKTNTKLKIDKKTVSEYALAMNKSTVEALENAIAMINIDCIDETQENFNNVLVAKSKTDDLFEMIETNLSDETEDIEKFKKYNKILGSLRKSEKIADRAMSIASLLLYANVGGDIYQV